MMAKKKTGRSAQPPMPPKCASPTEIKAWVAKCKAQYTPEELAEYEETGEALNEIFRLIGFDPKTGGFDPKAGA